MDDPALSSHVNIDRLSASKTFTGGDLYTYKGVASSALPKQYFDAKHAGDCALKAADLSELWRKYRDKLSLTEKDTSDKDFILRFSEIKAALKDAGKSAYQELNLAWTFYPDLQTAPYARRCEVALLHQNADGQRFLEDFDAVSGPLIHTRVSRQVSDVEMKIAACLVPFKSAECKSNNYFSCENGGCDFKPVTECTGFNASSTRNRCRMASQSMQDAGATSQLMGKMTAFCNAAYENKTLAGRLAACQCFKAEDEPVFDQIEQAFTTIDKDCFWKACKDAKGATAKPHLLPYFSEQKCTASQICSQIINIENVAGSDLKEMVPSQQCGMGDGKGPDANPDANPDGNPDGTGLPQWVFLLIGLCVLVAIGVGVYAMRRAKAAPAAPAVAAPAAAAPAAAAPAAAAPAAPG
jgi:hypothetical protein